MLEKLKQVEARYAEIEAKLADPAWYSDSEQIQKLYREQRELQSVAETYRAYQRAEADLEQAKSLLGDPELGDMAKEELADAKERLSKLEQELRILEYMFSNQGQIMTREQLAVKIWGCENEAEYNNVEVYMSFTRKKLAFVGSNVEIKAVRGLGYELREKDV